MLSKYKQIYAANLGLKYYFSRCKITLSRSIFRFNGFLANQRAEEISIETAEVIRLNRSLLADMMKTFFRFNYVIRTRS